MPQEHHVIDRLEAVSAPYKALLCDVWGVVHNGVVSFPDAIAALSRARADGKTVVLMTNAPRPRREVEAQLQALGVPQSAFDAVVTSGDVTRALITDGPRRIFHLGPDRDAALYDGLDVELVEEFEASGVVCTGLFDDRTERPEDYADMLRRMRARDLPFVCANPDIVVERGDRMIWCAGALARDYAQLGGRVSIAGKPYRPIYEAAVAAAAGLRGEALSHADVLAIGDGILTDIKGAAAYGCDVLFVTAGIHAHEYGGREGPDPERLLAFLSSHGMEPVASIRHLR
jgi:HAD superfamily hydrolase (TIGR01459 family)